MIVTVDDPFGVNGDAALPTLARCVDPVAIQSVLDRGVVGLCPPGAVQLRAIRVIRYKPGRRCLIEYDLVIPSRGNDEIAFTAIGKVRRNRPGRHQLRLQQAFWDAGFDDACSDGISVPEPLGEIPEMAMWLQRRVAGVVATDLLPGPRGAALAGRLADAAWKIHSAGVPARKVHRIGDELRILGDCLRATASRRPELASRIDLLTAECARAAAAVEPLPSTGIHRDFYPDQVVIDGERLTVVDFDLYTAGDPGLDIGNLLGHVTEQALRELGSPTALIEVETAAEERFVKLAGTAARRPVRLFAALTIARHVFLADERAARAPFVTDLLELARERVDAVIR